MQTLPADKPYYVKIAGTATTGALRHLKSQHPTVEIQKRKREAEPQDADPNVQSKRFLPLTTSNRAYPPKDSKIRRRTEEETRETFGWIRSIRSS